jgi:hypothetical protein
LPRPLPKGSWSVKEVDDLIKLYFESVATNPTRHKIYETMFRNRPTTLDEYTSAQFKNKIKKLLSNNDPRMSDRTPPKMSWSVKEVDDLIKLYFESVATNPTSLHATMFRNRPTTLDEYTSAQFKNKINKLLRNRDPRMSRKAPP